MYYMHTLHIGDLYHVLGQARLEDSGAQGKLTIWGPLYITMSNIAYVIRSAVVCKAH